MAGSVSVMMLVCFECGLVVLLLLLCLFAGLVLSGLAAVLASHGCCPSCCLCSGCLLPKELLTGSFI